MPKMSCVQCVVLFEWVAMNLFGNVMPELFSNRKISGMMFDYILEFESLLEIFIYTYFILKMKNS